MSRTAPHASQTAWWWARVFGSNRAASPRCPEAQRAREPGARRARRACCRRSRSSSSESSARSRSKSSCAVGCDSSLREEAHDRDALRRQLQPRALEVAQHRRPLVARGTSRRSDARASRHAARSLTENDSKLQAPVAVAPTADGSGANGRGPSVLAFFAAAEDGELEVAELALRRLLRDVELARVARSPTGPSSSPVS